MTVANATVAVRSYCKCIITFEYRCVPACTVHDILQVYNAENERAT